MSGSHRGGGGWGVGDREEGRLFIHLELCILGLGRNQKLFQSNQSTSNVPSVHRFALGFNDPFPRLDRQTSMVQRLPLCHFDFIVHVFTAPFVLSLPPSDLLGVDWEFLWGQQHEAVTSR